MNDKKMVDGIEEFLTDAEQAEKNAREAAWRAGATDRAAKAALPDLATQVAHLTSALLDLGASLPDTVIAAANDKFSAIGQPEISMKPIGIGKVAL